jgi:hypothetical protein
MHHEVFHGEQVGDIRVTDFIEQFHCFVSRSRTDGGEIAVLPATDEEWHAGTPNQIILSRMKFNPKNFRTIMGNTNPPSIRTADESTLILVKGSGFLRVQQSSAVNP